MSINWKCSVDEEPETKRVLVYDHETETISGAEYVKPKNEGQTPYFVLDCGGTKKITQLIFFAKPPKMDQHILKVYKNHF